MASHSMKSKKLRAGDALMLEHDDIRAELARTAMESGSIGEAAKRLAHLCVPHFEQEEKQVFPVLDLLHDLASGVVQPEMASVLPLVSLFRARHQDLDDHHESIMMAVDALVAAAREGRNKETAYFAYQIWLHERMEELVIYPTVTLIGEYLSEKLAES